MLELYARYVYGFPEDGEHTKNLSWDNLIDDVMS